MYPRYLLPLLFGVSSLNLIIVNPSLSSNRIAQLDNITNITTDILNTLGYECDTVSAAAIICTKCSSNNNITEKCSAYICDIVTKKCRKKKATLPKLPNSNRDEEKKDSIIPSF